MSSRFTKGKLAGDITDDDLMVAFGEAATGATLTRCAQAIGTNRYELKRKIDSDPELKEVWERAQVAAGDFYEEMYRSKALKGDPNAIKFLLLTKKPEYKDTNVKVTHTIEQPTASLLAQAREAGNDASFRDGVLAVIEAMRLDNQRQLSQGEVIDHE